MQILAIGAHPDDLEYGCGGTLLKFAAKGHRICLLVMSSGEMGGDPRIRQKEQRESARILGSRLLWGGLRDTRIPLTKALINKIEKVIKEFKPDLIFTHFHNDTHQDHRKISQATTTATRYIRNVLFYEVPTTLDFNPSMFVDIGSVMENKFRLLAVHKSQVYQTKIPDLPIYENAKSCAIFRGFQNRVKFAEGFMPLRYSLDLNI